MPDEQNMQVLYEEIPQEPIQPDPVEAPEVAQAAPVVPTVEQQQKTEQKRYTQELQEQNWREIRRIQEQKDRELDLMRREIEQLRAASVARQETPKDELGIPKDAYTEVRHVEKIVQSALEKQQAEFKRQLAEEKRLSAERSISKEYPDLYQVISPENLRRLEVEEPEIAACIAATPDDYAAKVAAYKQIKKMGIAENNYNSRRVEERLAENAQRPKNPAAVMPRQGSPALQAATPASGYAETLTDDMMMRARKEMEEAIARM